MFRVHLDLDAAQSLPVLLLGEFLLLLTTVVIPTGTMIGFTREPAATFGWGSGNRLRQLGIGVIAGLTLMSVLIGLIALWGGITIKVSRDAPSALAMHACGYAVAFTMVAFSEEGLLRGYALVQLSRALSFNGPRFLLEQPLFRSVTRNT